MAILPFFYLLVTWSFRAMLDQDVNLEMKVIHSRAIRFKAHGSGTVELWTQYLYTSL